MFKCVIELYTIFKLFYNLFIKYDGDHNDNDAVDGVDDMQKKKQKKKTYDD